MIDYAATVERDGKIWLVHVTGPDFDHWTQARNLREVELMARDLVAVMLEVEHDSFNLSWSVTLPDAVRAHLARASQLRDESERANREAAVESRQAARALRADGLSIREIGEVLGISHQRAHQLVQ